MGQLEDRTDDARGMAGAVSDAPQQLTRKAEGNPIAAGFVAFGLGLVAAALIPPTETERELAETMAPQIERTQQKLSDVVTEGARAVADEVRPQVQDSIGELRSSAKDSAERVQDQISS